MSSKRGNEGNSLSAMIDKRERLVKEIARLEDELRQANTQLSGVNRAIAVELGLPAAGSGPEPAAARKRMSATELHAAQADVLGAIHKAQGPVSRREIAQRLTRELQPTQISNILRVLKEDGRIKQTGERRDTRYVAL